MSDRCPLGDLFFFSVGLVIAELFPYGTLRTEYLEKGLSKDHDIWFTDCAQGVDDLINF